MRWSRSTGSQPTALSAANVEQVTLDLTDAAATAQALTDARADAVIHLAAIAVPFSAPEDVILRTNAALAMSVLGGAVQAGIPKIVAASSPTVLGYGAPKGWTPDRLPLDEDSPTLPWNAYALSKLLIEQSIAMLQRQTGDAVRFAAFRPCYVIAPEEWAGAPTQQGHTVRERLDDPALSAPALFNYVDARDVATFADTLLGRPRRHPQRRGLLRRRRRCARPRAARRACSPVSIPAPRPPPRRSPARARPSRTRRRDALLGWTPEHDWRTELARADDRTDVHA